MDVFSLLTQLEDAIGRASRVPLTSRVVLDPEEVLALIDAIRDHLPVEIQEAARLSGEKQRILEEARAEAERIVHEAKLFAEKLTDEVAVTKEAQVQAEQLIDRAKAVSRQVRAGAIHYAEDVLNRVAEQLKAAEGDIQRSRDELLRWESGQR